MCYDAPAQFSGEADVPTIAYFLGIAVRMFFNDHDPPHFHARYQGFRARIRIADDEISMVGYRQPWRAC